MHQQFLKISFLFCHISKQYLIGILSDLFCYWLTNKTNCFWGITILLYIRTLMFNVFRWDVIAQSEESSWVYRVSVRFVHMFQPYILEVKRKYFLFSKIFRREWFRNMVFHERDESFSSTTCHQHSAVFHIDYHFFTFSRLATPRPWDTASRFTIYPTSQRGTNGKPANNQVTQSTHGTLPMLTIAFVVRTLTLTSLTVATFLTILTRAPPRCRLARPYPRTCNCAVVTCGTSPRTRHSFLTSSATIPQAATPHPL